MGIFYEYFCTAVIVSASHTKKNFIKSASNPDRRGCRRGAPDSSGYRHPRGKSDCHYRSKNYYFRILSNRYSSCWSVIKYLDYTKSFYCIHRQTAPFFLFDVVVQLVAGSEKVSRSKKFRQGLVNTTYIFENAQTVLTPLNCVTLLSLDSDAVWRGRQYSRMNISHVLASSMNPQHNWKVQDSHKQATFIIN